MVKHVFVFYVLPLFSTGIGCIMPKDQFYIGCTLFAVGILILCWAAFKDIKSYLKKRKGIKAKKEEQLPKEPHVYDILDDCDYDEYGGWYTNRKTDTKYCASCWDDRRSKIHLRKVTLSRWVCPKCKRKYDSRIEMWKNLFMKKPISSMIR